MFTFLAALFLVVLLVGVFYGFGIVMRKPPTTEELETETCSLCRRKFAKSLLLERPVGDSHLFYFCQECIQKLRDDAERLIRRSPEN